MRVRIVAVEAAAGGAPIVEVEAAAGRLVAAWHGPAPAVGATADVEWTIDHAFTWGVDVAVVPPRPPAIVAGPGRRATVWAPVDAIDDDGAVFLRLGAALVAIAVDGAAHGAPVGATAGATVGATVRVDIPAVTLFPYTL